GRIISGRVFFVQHMTSTIFFFLPLEINLQKQLVKIHNGVRKFQRQLTDVKPTPELIEKLKEIMTEVELSINTLKEDQHLRAFQSLVEIMFLFQKTKPPDGDLPPDVRALESFLQRTGGPNGGWDEYDHKAFLRVWTKHSGQPAYRREAKLYLPGKMLEDIERHEEWYQELIHLQDRKREVKRGGKAQQRLNKDLTIMIMFTDTKQNDLFLLGNRTNNLSSESKCNSKRVNTVLVQCPQHLYQLKFISVNQEERRRQLEAKMAVEKQLRLRREDEEEQERRRREKEQREMEERRREAAVGIRCFQERVWTLGLFVIITLSIIHVPDKICIYLFPVQVEGHISRDPSRLTRPTKGWEERMKHIGPSGGGPVLQMFHRAVPSWRQGL
uniref:Coiled-coil domain containing 112 n=1 Tax=Myripristis murdjan TaxID=586833 RepID=A0A668APD8_9TELE